MDNSVTNSEASVPSRTAKVGEFLGFALIPLGMLFGAAAAVTGYSYFIWGYISGWWPLGLSIGTILSMGLGLWCLLTFSSGQMPPGCD